MVSSSLMTSFIIGSSSIFDGNPKTSSLPLIITTLSLPKPLEACAVIKEISSLGYFFEIILLFFNLKKSSSFARFLPSKLYLPISNTLLSMPHFATISSSDFSIASPNL